MIFNSLSFIIFFIFFFLVYYYLNSKAKKYWLLIGSYFFYGWWNPYYLFLIWLSTITDYWTAKQIEKNTNKQRKKIWLIISIVINLGILITFKYSNFIINNINRILPYFHRSKLELLNLLLPVGISFYTFQTMGYTIDVFRNKIKAEKSIINFALYVSFFPQLVAGPIERAKNLLPQIKNKITISPSNFEKGLYLTLWGYFLKVVVADNLAPFSDVIFNNPQNYKGLEIILGVLFFSFQIYCDFAGYTNIARGLAYMLGFKLMENFKQPYSATSIRNFWRRWHISLSTWFKDYLYIPLGGSKTTFLKWIFAVFITFTISGLWHGANWTFILWGMIFGILYITEALIKKRLNNKIKNFLKNSPFALLVRKTAIFITVSLLWIIFRANSLTQVKIIFLNLFTPKWNINLDHKSISMNILLIGIVAIVDKLEKYKRLELRLLNQPIYQQMLFIYLILFAIFFIGNWHIHPFIYFQF